MKRWIQTISINESLRFIKKKNPVQYTSDLIKFEKFDEPLKTIDTKNLKYIEDEIHKMPEGYRRIFLLYVAEGLTHSEIADFLDISINTSKSQLLKARKYLQLKLNKMNQENSDKEIKKGFESLDVSIQKEADSRKDRVWDSLDINSKAKPSTRKYLWLLLGLLFSFIGMLVYQYTSKQTIDITQYAEVENAELIQLKGELSDFKNALESMHSIMDSLNKQNSHLEQAVTLLKTEQVSESKQNPSALRIIDTIYIPTVVTENLVVEKIIKDTIYIELSKAIDKEEAITDLANSKIENPPEEANRKASLHTRNKPSSVKFNFNEIVRPDE